MHGNQVWFLALAVLAIALAGVAAGQGSRLPQQLTTYLIGGTVLLTLFASPRKSRLTITFLSWILLHLLWLGLVVYVGGAHLVVAARAGKEWNGLVVGFLPSALALLALFVHAKRFISAVRRFREEVLGRPPIKLLFLWVFGPGQRLNSLFLGVGAFWRCIGTLHLLQGGGMIGTGGTDVLKYLRGRERQLIATTPEQVEQ